MKRVMVMYKVRPEYAAANEELVRAVYEELGRSGLKPDFTPRDLIASLGVEHVVEFSAGNTGLDLAGVRSMAGVRDVRTENGSVLLQVTELHRSVPALLDELGRQGVPLTELRTHSATLEDVFVHLTGRHLRDE